MKNFITLIAVFLFIGVSTARSQSLIDKVNRTLDKADNASNTAGKAGTTSDKIFGLFKKKKKADATNPNPVSGYKTVITIKGITMENLRKLNTNLKGCTGVDSTKMKYSSIGSIILVAHARSTEDLLTALEKTSKSIFTDKNIESMEEGKIDIALAKD